jgi:hypothetical protein
MGQGWIWEFVSIGEKLEMWRGIVDCYWSMQTKNNLEREKKKKKKTRSKLKKTQKKKKKKKKHDSRGLETAL